MACMYSTYDLHVASEVHNMCKDRMAHCSCCPTMCPLSKHASVDAWPEQGIRIDKSIDRCITRTVYMLTPVAVVTSVMLRAASLYAWPLWPQSALSA